MKEMTIQELELSLSQKSNNVVLVYTNMCGTCIRAKEMLKVVELTLKDIEFYQLNVNMNSSVIEYYQITSIPCFLIYRQGLLVDKFYAFHSVTYLFNKIKSFYAE